MEKQAYSMAKLTIVRGKVHFSNIHTQHGRFRTAWRREKSKPLEGKKRLYDAVAVGWTRIYVCDDKCELVNFSFARHDGRRGWTLGEWSGDTFRAWPDPYLPLVNKYK